MNLAFIGFSSVPADEVDVIRINRQRLVQNIGTSDLDCDTAACGIYFLSIGIKYSPCTIALLHVQIVLTSFLCCGLSRKGYFRSNREEPRHRNQRDLLFLHEDPSAIQLPFDPSLGCAMALKRSAGTLTPWGHFNLYSTVAGVASYQGRERIGLTGKY